MDFASRPARQRDSPGAANDNQVGAVVALPRMTKLIDLVRDTVLNRGVEAGGLLPDTAPTAIPAVPASQSAPANGHTATMPSVTHDESRLDNADPADTTMFLDGEPLDAALNPMPDIFGGDFGSDSGLGDTDNFSFARSLDDRGPESGTLTIPSAPASQSIENSGLVFDHVTNDHLIDFTELPSDTPAPAVSSTPPAVNTPVANNAPYNQVHPVGCGCHGCAQGAGDEHDHGHAHASDGGDTPTPVDGSPTSGFTISTIPTTGQNDIDSLLQTYRWGSGSATVEMTYSFGTSASVYQSGYSEPTNGFGEFSEHQKAATRSVLDYWANVANITFTEVTDSATVAGDFRFAKSSEPSTAWAYLPNSGATGGDVWVGPSSYYNDMSEGTYGFQTMLHEMGHALGLMHTHQGAVSATSDIDWTGYSVMSYRSYVDAPLTGYTQSYYPTTPMINDIKAVQHIYGANTTHNSDDTTYSWTTGGRILETIWDAGGTDTIDWSNQSTAAEINLTSGVWSKLGPSYYSKWPTAEDRTLMIAENAVIENAIGGSAADTIAGNTAANVLTGGGGNDTLSGGSGNDRFVFASGFGSDTISDFTAGSGSDDTLDFTSYGYTTYAEIQSNVSIADVSGNAVLTIGSDSVTLTGVASSSLDVDDFFGVVAGATAGDDTLLGTSGIDFIDGLAGNDSIGGNAGNDVLRGGTGNDTISGNAGNDTIYGDAGADVINGGAGDDSLSGGAGRDTFTFSTSFGNDTINDFTVGFDSIDLSALSIADYTALLAATADVSGNAVITLSGNTITLTGVTKSQLQQGDFIGVNPVGTSGNDVITGFDTNDTINGLAGNDVINGGAGDDILNGGDGDDRLIGGTGADAMTGGDGDDTYLVDNVGDTITEGSAASTDTVISSISFTLGDNVENLELSLTSNIDGTGNSLANRITGNAGNNVLTGNGGNDSLFGLAGDDTLNGGDGFDSLIGGDGADTVNAGAGDDWVRGEAGNDILNGDAGIDKIFGEAGNDTLDGGAGNDILTGGTGDDTYVVDSNADRVIENSNEGTDTIQSAVSQFALAANVENLTLTGTSDINGTGNDLNNTITGNSGANILIGGGGNDTLIGGAGSDTYIISDNTDTIVESSAAAGTDKVISSISFSLAGGAGNGIETLELSLSSDIDGTGNSDDNTLIGNSGNNTLTGNSGNDRLEGRAGTDKLIGGSGDDTYVITDGLDTVTEEAGAGTDTVESHITYTLGSNLENLTLIGSGHINATGNSGDNTITGGSGRNRIDGGTGADTMAGGAGDDTYVVDNLSDTVTENALEGTDLVESSVSFTLSSNVENLRLAGTSDLNATGSSDNNFIRGNSGINTLSGMAGDDIIFGFGGNDSIDGGTGADSLFGDAGDDTINGGLGNDILRGGAGRDTFIFSSGFGDDTINDFTTNFDQIDIQASGITDFTTLMSGTTDVGGNAVITIGSDTITITGVLKAALSQTDFVGVHINGTSGDDTINGFVTNDVINGLAGNDWINGGAGNDTISGGAGNDRLIGHTGADAMSGGTGDDIYVIDDIADTTTENAGEGTDGVESSISWTLGANIENLKLTGFDNTNGHGNSEANELRGNAANNTLNGNGGTDTIYGFRGDDILWGGSVADSLLGGHDHDTLHGAGGNDSLDGEEGNDVLYGDAGDDTLLGGDGNDTLDGGTGDDNMSGNAGNDIYIVDSTSDTITEASGEGTDAVQSSVSYTLSSNVENLTLTGSSDLNATGNASDNFLQGNSGVNTLAGNDGNDIIYGFGGNDAITGGAGTDSLYGDAGTDTLDGGAGDDSLRGGAGRDTFVFNAGFGNDTLHDFTVNFDSIDLTSLNVGSYASLLSNTADVSGDAVITLSGNTITISNVTKSQLLEGDFIGLTAAATSGNDTLNGLETADNIDGLGGNDTIFGNGGDDTLAGNTGNDVIDGGSGADAMSGGTGDDTFVVDNASDTVSENASEGTDLVQSSVTWTLGANTENLTLTGTSNIDGTGHSGNNTINGNSGNNVLTGNGGSDALYGNAGDDTLHGGSVADTLIGGTGNDTVNGAGGNDWIRGEDGNDILNGEAGRDRIFGEAGNDTLRGGDDIDTLTGGLGDDIFDYNALSEIGDVITDFEAGANGDAMDMIGILSAVGYGGGDALGDGRVRAIQNASDTLIQIDTTGSNDYATVATLQSVTATEVIADNWIFS